ncbi:LPXTG cell wall anchor domain-containing protein [Abyssicoccus albus]
MQDVQLEEAPSDELPRTGESQTSLNVLIGLLISMIGTFVLIFSKRRT